MHQIDIILSDLPENVCAFVCNEIKKCEQLDFEVLMPNKMFVHCGTLKTNGYFDQPRKQLAVAVGKPMEQWLDTFVHESCHKDQYVEHSKLWGQTVRGCDPFTVVEMWLNEVVELKELPKYQMIMSMLRLELDCEKRAVKKIRKNKLPINIKTYTQKANSYVYFYHILAEMRKWYTIGYEPYNVAEVWQAMPTTFKNDYTEIPAELRALYLKHCYNGVPRRL